MSRSPRSRLVSLPQAVGPANGEVSLLEAGDGVALRVARWPAATGVPARGAVLLLHGYTEFIEKYYEVVADLQARGHAVVTFDWRGQGLSERLLPGRQRGYVTSFADLAADALRVFETGASELRGPHLLMAHSMGGNVALRLLEDEPGRFDRAVLSAPMIGWDGLPVWLMNAIATLHVVLGLGGAYAWGARDVDLATSDNRVTSDPERYRLARDFWRLEPGLVTHGVTWRWVREAARSISLVMDPRRVARIRTPTLIASAGRDLVVSSRLHERLASMNPAFTLARLGDSMHEILQERDEIRAAFWDHFDRFAEDGSG